MTTTESSSVTDRAAASAPNMFLLGPFAPVEEEVTATELTVTGELPPELDGRYLRIGPNPAGEVDPATYHWFAGDGMVHGVRLRDGRAEWYRNRWVRSPKVARLLGEPEPRPARSVQGDGGFAANTNVIGHSGRTYALVESGPLPYELTDELDTVGPCDFGGTLAAGYTAHPHRDPDTGELHAVTYFLLDEGPVQYSVLGTDGRIRRTVDVEVSGNPLMHDFGLTENHVVLFDLPVTFDPAQTTATTASEAINAGLIPYGWKPDHPARLGVLPRHGASSEVRWFEIEPCFVFHCLNAHEERPYPGGPVERIVLDVMRYPTMFTTTRTGPDNLATLDRWTIDLVTGRVRDERVDDRPQEFPRLDERRAGRAYRYGYTAGLFQPTVLKHDLEAKTTAVHSFDAGDFAGEFVFVPTAADSDEDDGVLMGIVHRAATDRGDLVLLDAGSLEPVAMVHLPARVPNGFHGNWVPA